jgi:hypothetical protein
MQALIDVFKMDEIQKETRIKVIKQLGRAINQEYGSNITEEIVVELVLLLDPSNDIKNDDHYKIFIGK